MNFNNERKLWAIFIITCWALIILNIIAFYA